MTPVSQTQSWTHNLNVPNAITLVRIVLIGVFGLLLVQGHDAWAITTLAVAGASDFLDGFLARRLNQTSSWGAVLDPAADRILTVVVVVGLAWRDIIPWWLVAVLLTRDVMVGLSLLWLRSRKGQLPAVTFVGKSATFGLYFALPLAYLSFDRWELWHTIALVLAVLATVLYWVSGVQYVVQSRRNARLESSSKLG